MIYLDNNATTRVFDETVEAMRPFLTTHFANPASAFGSFSGLGRTIASAKTDLARRLGYDEGQSFLLTSGSTEANNLALIGAARANKDRRHIIVAATEHPSVLEAVRYLESTGYRISVLPVSAAGLIEPSKVAAAVSPDTLLVSVMLANNESGVINPVAEIANLIKKCDPSVLIHSDATQAVGKHPIDLTDELASVDLLSLSAHKFHGPKGVGALFVREQVSISPILFGGGQQAGLRSGTENPAGLLGMVSAICNPRLSPMAWEAMRALRDDFEERIASIVQGARALGRYAPRLPNTSFIFLPGYSGSDLVDFMASNEVAISLGSACAHGAQAPSHVALAMGLRHEDANNCVRISLSVETSAQDIEHFFSVFASFN